MLRAHAPLRIDLAGGTLDIWPLYLLLGGGLTVNLAIDRRAEARLEERDDRGIRLVAEDLGLAEEASSWEGLDAAGELGLVKRLIRFYRPARGFRLRTSVAAPPGAGLGGSSALALAVAALLERFCEGTRSVEELILLLRDLEAEALGVPTGVQDYYAAAFGGLNAIRLEPGGAGRERLRPRARFLKELSERLLLVYTGTAHRSGRLNWEVVRRAIDGEPSTRAALAELKEAALAMRAALLEEDLPGVAAALRAEWAARQRLAPGIVTPRMEKLAGLAEAAKPCGAGGGGALLLLAGEGTAERLRAARLSPLRWRPTERGLTVEEV